MPRRSIVTSFFQKLLRDLMILQLQVVQLLVILGYQHQVDQTVVHSVIVDLVHLEGVHLVIVDHQYQEVDKVLSIHSKQVQR